MDEAVNNASIHLKVFAYDLDEPEIARRLLKLAKENRLKIILDDAGDHGEPASFETDFANEFKAVSNPAFIERGSFKALSLRRKISLAVIVLIVRTIFVGL